MKKQYQFFIKSIIVLIIVLTFILTANGCKNISKIGEEKTAKKKLAQKDTKNADNKDPAASKKIFSLGKAQKSDIFEYIPSKVKRSSSITGDLGWQYRTEVNPNATKPTDNGVTYSAGNGRKFVLVFITVKNITDMPQEPLLTYDPQPTLESTTTNKTYEYDSPHSFRLKESEQFNEAETLEPGKIQSGWVLFDVPSDENNLLFKIEDLLWHI